MAIEQILLYLVFINSALGGYVLNYNWRSKQNRFFALICFGISMWIGGMYWLQATYIFYWADKLTLLGGIITVAGFYLFSRIFPNELPGTNFFNRQSLIVQIVPLAALLLPLPFNLYIENIRIVQEGFVAINGPLFPLMFLTLAAYIFMSVWNIFAQLRNSFGFARQKIFYFMLGFFILVTSTLFFDLVLPALGISELKFVGPLSTVIFIGFVAYSLVSYQLMDIRLVGKLLVVNALSLLTAIGLALVFERLHPTKNLQSLAVNLIFGICMFTLFRNFFGQAYQRVFMKNYINARQDLALLNQFLNKELDSRKIILLTNKYIRSALNLAWIYYFDFTKHKAIFGPDQNMENLANLSDRQIFDNKLNRAAQKALEPTFFPTLVFDAFEKSGPVGILPIRDKGKHFGYFVLGPQVGLNGLSAEEEQKIKSSWLHIKTAFARAVLYEDLENKVHSQVEDITYKNRKLKEVTENRLEFLQMASHQLRTPITALSGSLQLLEEGNLSGKEKSELIKIASDRSKNLANVIKGILNLSKVENTAESEISQLTSLKKVFLNILPVLEPKLASRRIFFRASEENFDVVGNAMYLEQAFFNILENAIEHTSAGEVSINYIAEPNYVIVAIKDSGPGIEEEYREKIFKKYVRGKQSGGTGLGLYLVKAIISAHPRGHVWFETGDTGTTFFVRLKRAIEPVK